MSFITIGHHEDAAEIGDVGCLLCPTCHEKTPARALVYYTYFQIWYLFSFVTDSRYVIVCNTCGTMCTVSAATLEAAGHSVEPAIPFLRRKGWMVFLGLVLCLMGSAVVYEQMSNHRRNRIIADPKPGDLYLGILTVINNTGFDNSTAAQLGGPGYGGLKLVSSSDERRLFVTTSKVWNQKNGLERYLKSQEVAYDTEKLVLFTTEEILSLCEKGFIYDASRGEPLVIHNLDKKKNEAEERGLAKSFL